MSPREKRKYTLTEDLVKRTSMINRSKFIEIAISKACEDEYRVVRALGHRVASQKTEPAEMIRVTITMDDATVEKANTLAKVTALPVENVIRLAMEAELMEK